MYIVSHKNIGYTEHLIYKNFKDFFDGYLIERDVEKTLSLLDDGIFTLGTVKDEITVEKEEFCELLKQQLEVLSDKADYKVDEFYAKEIVDNVWEVAATIKVVLGDKGQDNMEYITRFTGSFKIMGEDYVICSCYISKGNYNIESREFVPIKFYFGNNLVDKRKSEQAALDIICKAMPGGIVAGYKAEGFPICFVNDKYLELLGYSSYEEYANEIQGLALNSIHPDDRDMVTEAINTSYDADEQYGIEYRIKHKNGKYIYVYDIGKKLTTLDNREIIICVLIDVTETVKMRQRLAKESASDELTGIYNRRGGIRIMEHHLKQGQPYTFAIFDIDNLKKLNDEYNHIVGDVALKKFAELMKEIFDEETTLSRFGGDEFIAYIPKKLSKEYIEDTLTILQNAYNKFAKENYPRSHSSVSIGCVSGTRKTTFDILYQAADELMYSIKKSGKNGCQIVEMD